MRILLVEDIERQAENLERELRENLVHHGYRDVEFVTLATEEAFLGWHGTATSDPGCPLPDVAVIDLMLPYRRPRLEDFADGNVPLPVGGPIDQAGFRCARKLRGTPRTAGIPMVFYTALPPDLVEDGLTEFPKVPHKRKDGDYALLAEIMLGEIKGSGR